MEVDRAWSDVATTELETAETDLTLSGLELSELLDLTLVPFERPSLEDRWSRTWDGAEVRERERRGCQSGCTPMQEGERAEF